MSILEDKKTRLRALLKKEEKLDAEIVKRLGVRLSQVDFDDPAIGDITAKMKPVMAEINEVYWEIAKLEHDASNPRMNYYARRSVDAFLQGLGDSFAACEFLKEINMSSHELIEAVAIDPNFMDGMFNDC